MDTIQEIKKRVADALQGAKGIVITTNGEIKRTEPENGTDYDLETLQSIVGGYIEIVRVRINGKDYHLVADEDGYMHRQEGNMIASIVYGHQLVGNILICELDAIK